MPARSAALLSVLSVLEEDLDALHESVMSLIRSVSDEATARHLIGLSRLVSKMRSDVSRPLAQEWSPQPRVEGQPAPSLRRKVLVVDDERQLGQSLTRTVGRLHEVAFEATVDGALLRLEQGEKFDFILSDLLLPGKTGMEFFDRISAGYPELVGRVIFMTAAVSHPKVIKFLKANKSPLLVKPFTSLALESLII